MSRTDKDVPSWVTVELWEPNHHFRCQAGWLAGYRAPETLRPCTLPDEPVRQNPTQPAPWRSNRTTCYWEPEFHYQPHRPSSQDRRWYWWGPDRARVRDACRKATQEYNGSGETEIEVPNQNHHHCPRSGWWN